MLLPMSNKADLGPNSARIVLLQRQMRCMDRLNTSGERQWRSASGSVGTMAYWALQGSVAFEYSSVTVM